MGRAFDQNPETTKLERVSSHLKDACDILGFNQIATPVLDKNIPKIEREHNISINLFGHEGEHIFPIWLTKKLSDKHANLLVTSNEETNHYVLIKDFNKLCYNVTKIKRKQHFCMQCIQHFTTEEILQKHIPECTIINKSQAVELPKKGSILKSKSIQQTMKVPFVLYADFEALLESLEDKNKTHKHIACS